MCCRINFKKKLILRTLSCRITLWTPRMTLLTLSCSMILRTLFWMMTPRSIFFANKLLMMMMMTPRTLPVQWLYAFYLVMVTLCPLRQLCAQSPLRRLCALYDVRRLMHSAQKKTLRWLSFMMTTRIRTMTRRTPILKNDSTQSFCRITLRTLFCKMTLRTLPCCVDDSTHSVL